MRYLPQFLQTTILSAIVLTLTALITEPLQASGFAVRVGPPGIGRGGTNPITLGPTDWQFEYISDSLLETHLSVTGIFVGRRHPFSNGAYVSVGGGLPISANGTGLGVYSSFGVDLICGLVCFSAEYQQAVGISGSTIISPYAVRLGISSWF